MPGMQQYFVVIVIYASEVGGVLYVLRERLSLSLVLLAINALGSLSVRISGVSKSSLQL